MGEDLITSVAEMLRRSDRLVGANSCEWASTDGEITILQLMHSVEQTATVVDVPDALKTPQAADISRLVRRFPGPLGEALVLPWAIAAPTDFLSDVEPAGVEPLAALAEVQELVRAQVADVWTGPKPSAMDRATRTLRELRGDDPGAAMAETAALRTPDTERAAAILSLLARVRVGLVEAGAVSRPELGWHVPPGEARKILAAGRADELRTRIGFDRWEPFDAAVVIGGGNAVEGLSGAPGIAVGRMCFIANPGDTAHFRPRDVVVGTHPLPSLAALLWDASALITTGGGPAAHLFESARALAIPAVTALDLERLLGGDPAGFSGEVSLAVDGNQGRVWAAKW